MEKSVNFNLIDIMTNSVFIFSAIMVVPQNMTKRLEVSKIEQRIELLLGVLSINIKSNDLLCETYPYLCWHLKKNTSFLMTSLVYFCEFYWQIGLGQLIDLYQVFIDLICSDSPQCDDSNSI